MDILATITKYWPMLSLCVFVPLSLIVAYAAVQRVKEIARDVVRDELQHLAESCTVSDLRLDDVEQQISQLTEKCFDREFQRRHFPRNGRTTE